MAGMEIKSSPKFVQDKRYVISGVITWLVCIVFGSCAMAWHIYKLNLLQIVGGIYGTYICYLLINQLRHTSFVWKCLCYVGRNSLPLLCIHSVDRVMNITKELTNQLLGYSALDVSHFQIEVILKLLFVSVFFVILKQIPVVRRIYQIKA